jgi:glycosyltransferase involved in cell wall biosynthesis
MKLAHREGISIITIVLNGELLIEETIKSVIHQNNVDFEYIIIDGGSTDGTLNIINKYKNHIAHFVSESDKGIYYAINKGISLASYELIGLIHSGDCYKENALSEAYNVFKKYDADVVYGDIEILEDMYGHIFSKTLIANHKLLKNEMTIFHPSSFVKHAIYLEYGYYNTNYRSASDYDLFLQLFLQNKKFIYIPKELATFRSDGISSKNLKLSLYENYLIRKNRIGLLNATIFKIRRILLNHFFITRTIILNKLLGKNNIILLKKFYFEKIKTNYRNI